MSSRKYEILKKQVMLTVLALTISGTVMAMPQNGQVTNGSGNIANQGNTMTINQSSNKMSINWHSFSIAKNETVNYRQPGSSSVALNRVTGNDPSAIYGALNANGQVFLINPNGVVFGQGAAVNVGGIAASAKNLSDADFLAGKYNFTGSSTAGILNEGNIQTAAGGYVAFLANQVTNTGSLKTPQGSVILGAGQSFTLAADNTGKINLAVNEAAVKAAAVNSGSIQADGGYVVLRAADAAEVVNSVVANTGIIQARSLKKDKGEIILDGSQQGIVNAGGTLDVSAAETNTAGGDITVKGLYTNVNNGAQLLAKGTGSSAGGTIETSGDYLYIDSGSVINASSEQGQGGIWSLDPLYVDIVADGGSACESTYENKKNSSITNKVNVSSINDSLNNGTSVAIVATDNNKVADILVNAAIAKTAGGNATLTLTAQRNVAINAPITSTSGALNMNFHSDSANQGVGAVEVNADLDSHGGNIVMGSGTNITDGTVGTYIGLTTAEFNQLIEAVKSGDINNINKPTRKITTLGGDLNIYGDLLLGIGGAATFDTTNGSNGGNVYVSGKVDSGNFYKIYYFSADDIKNGAYYWSDARNDAYTNSFGTQTSGGSDLWDSYLTNITSALENSIVLSTFTKTTDKDAYYIGAHAGSFDDLLNRQNNDRYWYWTDGPEAGKTFYHQTGSGQGNTSDTDYTYSAWHSNEPNNSPNVTAWPNGQNVATVGYDWPSKWDDNGANNRLTGESTEIKGYIQETNNLRTGLTVNAGSGAVTFGGDIGSQRTLYALNVNNTGDVTTKGTVTLSGDHFDGVQYGGDLDIESTGTVTMEKAVDATGHIYIGQKVSPTAVLAQSTLTAGGDDTVRTTADRNILIGTSEHRAGSVQLDALAAADDGIEIFSDGDVTANGLTAKGLVTNGNIVIDDSKENSLVTLKGTTIVGSALDDRDDITIYGDKMDLQGSVTTNGSTGVVTLSNSTAGHDIDLGADGDTLNGVLGLSSGEVNEVTASKLAVGNNQTATATKNIKITAAIAPTGTSVVHMYTGLDTGTIEETGSGTLTPGLNHTLNLAVTAAGSVDLDNENNITDFAAVSTDADNGTIRLNQGDKQLTVGTVDGLTGVTNNVKNYSSAIVLATRGSFVNQAGVNGVKASGTDSYWRIFSSSPAADKFGTGDSATYLRSDSYADWQTTYAKRDTVGTQAGGAANQDDHYNHYIFAAEKTIVVAPSDQTKKYGTDLTGNADYTTGYATGSKKNISVIADVYDTAAANDTATVTAALTNVTLSSTGFAQQAAAGTYSGTTDGIVAVLPTGLDGSTINGYKITAVPGTLTVDPLALTIHLSGERTYGAEKSGNVYTGAHYTVDNGAIAANNGLMSWDKDKYDAAVQSTTNSQIIDHTERKLDASDSAYTDQGSYLSLASTAAAADVFGNYKITYVDTYKVNQALLTIHLSGERTYGSSKSGDTFSAAKYTVDNGNKALTNGLKDWDKSAYNNYVNNTNLKDKTLSTTDADTYNSLVGTYLTVNDTAKNAAFLKNYTVTYADTYTVNKAPLEVTVSGSRVYGDASSNNLADYKLLVGTDQLKNDETINGGLDVANHVKITDNAGSYYKDYNGQQDTSDNVEVSGDVTGGNGFKASNYDITYQTIYTVVPAPLTIKAESQNISRGDQIAPLTSTYSGFKNNDGPSDILNTGLTTAGTSESDVGYYPITFTGVPYNANYVITTIPGALVIKAPGTDTNIHHPQVPTPAIPKVHDPLTIGGTHQGNDQGWGTDRIKTKESMPVYRVALSGVTREGAYDVSEDNTGVKMHPTLNIVSDPQDDATEQRTAVVQFTQDKVTGTFEVTFDGSIVKLLPKDAASEQLVETNKGTRYVSLYKGALNTALNDMGVVLESIKAVYLLA